MSAGIPGGCSLRMTHALRLSIIKDNRINWKLTSQDKRNVCQKKTKWKEPKQENYNWKPDHSGYGNFNQIKMHPSQP